MDNITLSIKGHTTRIPIQPIHTTTNFKRSTVEDDADVDDSTATERRTTTTTTTAAAAALKPDITAIAIAESSNTPTMTEAAAPTTEQQPCIDTPPTYLISERTFGDFERRFTFPVSIDQDGVRASMKNGILTIVVPKKSERLNNKRKIVIT